MAIENGIDKVRINPGNIGKREKVEAVVKACKEKGIPIRIGVNAGSLENHLLENTGTRHQKPWWKAPCIISGSSKNWISMISSFRLKLLMYRWRLRLHEGRGSNTIPASPGHYRSRHPVLGYRQECRRAWRAVVSWNRRHDAYILSADPVEEIKVGRELLKSFGLISDAATLVSCPTCGRLDIDLFSIANEVEEYISKIKVPIKVSVLGCAVNGPGEAREADIGIAGARGEGLLFRYGEMIRKVPEATMVEELKKEIDHIVKVYEETGEIGPQAQIHGLSWITKFPYR